MKATKEQIIAEANRRWDAELWPRHKSVIDHVIDIMCENWTPPEPVDPYVEAYWKWHKSVNPTGRLILNIADAYLAGARMAGEREQERAKVLVEYVKWESLNGNMRARAALAKYRGEA